MLRATGGLLLGLLLLACARPEPTVRPLAAEAMPVSFDYGSLAHGKRKFEEITDPRTGFTSRRMTVDGRNEWAIVAVTSLFGNYVFESTDAKFWVGRMLKSEVRLSWGESGTVRDGARPAGWQAFTFTAPPPSSAPQACVAFSRTLREHVEADPARAAQELVIAIYCRGSSLPINPAEMPAIAATLQTRA